MNGDVLMNDKLVRGCVSLALALVMLFGTVSTVTAAENVFAGTESIAVVDETADGVLDVTTKTGKSQVASSISEALDEANSDLGIIDSNELKSQGRDIVVVLDPGHGGSDSGATCNGLLEKDVNLKVAQRCLAELEQYAGVKVYMTRYDDTYVGLGERTDIARSYNCDAFVSIHMNSGGGTGVEVWYPNGNYREDISDTGYGIAGNILDNIVSLGMRKRGLKIRNSESGNTYPDGTIADYYSVIYTSKLKGFAGIIVEHGFMDGDYDKLSDDNFLTQLGVADATGIASYFKLNKGENLDDYEGAFDVNYYRSFNPDLWTLNDYECFTHYIDYGIWEGRDGSAIFNLQDYMVANPDLINAFGTDWRAYLRHFKDYGMDEGRTSIDSFSVRSYKNRYRDLRNAYGQYIKGYYMHFKDFGFWEGRVTIGYDNQLVGGGVSNVWVYDLSDVYDYDYYGANNADVKNAFGIDDTAMVSHFFDYGMVEGRQASSEFNVWAYAGRYKDLQDAFGWDMRQYYMHYIQCGKSEGRIAV